MTFKTCAALGGAVVLALGAAGAPAKATTITFDTTTYGPFAGPATESGFTYGVGSGSLFAESFGNPGTDIDGTVVGGGGVLDIVKASPGQFTFSGLDFAAFAATVGGDQTLDVRGYLGGAAVAEDSFTLPSSDVTLDWAHFASSSLAGVDIDDLKIALSAGGAGPYAYFEAVDNVTLGVVVGGVGGVPEPASWALMLAGFGGLGAALRSRRRFAFTAA